MAAMKRTYGIALKLLETRRRSSRPKAPETTSAGTAGPVAATQQPLRGIPSVEGMREWLQILGHSENDVNNLNIIHVSGTKGKGSTCAFTRSLLRAHSIRTGFPRRIGLYTGPHLQCIRERIQIDDHPVSEELFTRYFFEVWDRLMPQDLGPNSKITRKPRYLQLLALLAFHTFIKENVDAAIFEVHHGGEYDATNVIQKPVVTGITSLGIDHIAQLGPTIENIAWHKAGIFKPGAPAFSLNQEPGCAEIMRGRANAVGTSLTFVPLSDRLPPGGRVLSVPVQRMNFSLALEMAAAFLSIKSPSHSLNNEDIRYGAEAFSLTGRFEIIDEGRMRWFVDGAHNILSLREAAEWFASNIQRRYHPSSYCIHHRMPSEKPRGCHALIFSHLSDNRDGMALVRSLAHTLFKNNVRPDHVIFTSYREKDDSKNTPNASTQELCASYSRAWTELDPEAMVTSTSTIERAIKRTRELGDRENGMEVIVTGSLHMVGGALNILRP